MTTGELRLRIKKEQDRHIFEESYVSGAFKLGKPLWKRGIPLYYLIHIGGGYVSGDHYTQAIDVLPNASLYLTTQAATKVYKGVKPAIVETTIRLGMHSHLSLLQDPLILYEDAMFNQTVAVELTATSSFYYSEILTPGWSSKKQLFMYREYYNDFSITCDGKLLYVDRLFWQKGMQQKTLQLGNYSHYGTFVCIEQLPNDFYEALTSLAVEDGEIGFSKIGQHGFLLKVVAHQTQAIEATFVELDNRIRAMKLLEPLLLRKY